MDLCLSMLRVLQSILSTLGKNYKLRLETRFSCYYIARSVRFLDPLIGSYTDASTKGCPLEEFKADRNLDRAGHGSYPDAVVRASRRRRKELRRGYLPRRRKLRQHWQPRIA